MELIELDNAGNWNSAVKKIKRLHQLLWGEVQIIPLWEVDDYLVIRKNITGFPAQPMRTYHDIERWIVKPWYPTQTL
jgi:ABC-type transport system substrate-binding protein